MQIQQDLGADMYFAFDECTSPQATAEYQREAMERTHRWAQRSLDEHQRLEKKKKSIIKKVASKVSGQSIRLPQALFGVVQGGQHLDLRKESAKTLGEMDFDGYGIGGAFTKEDMAEAVRTACTELPEEKPRHMLGIGEPIDFFLGIENGMDLFDCVAPTRMARHGSVHTKDGKLNIKNAKNRDDFDPIEKDCACYACVNYSRAYICHLLREKEMLGATLASVHNLAFVIKLVDDIRQSMIDETFFENKKEFLDRYYGVGKW
jgi:queuine tRNA-ribosyltransferase